MQTIIKLLTLFSLLYLSFAAAYSQDCNSYFQRAEKLYDQSKYCEAKKYYQLYSNCNADVDVSTEIAMCERRCQIQVVEGEEETKEVETQIERKPDIIVLKNGNEIKSLVQEVGDEYVLYKKWESQTGVIYLMKSEVSMIKYQNGYEYVFKEAEKPVTKKDASIPEPTSAKNNENVETKYIPINEPTITSAYTQNNQEAKYQRSSLTMFLLQGTNYQEDKSKLDPNAVKIDNSPQAIKYLWDSYPFPDKYNEHNIGNVNINVPKTVTAQSIFAARKKKNQKKDAKEMRNKIEQELIRNRVAHKVVRKWFSSANGKLWDMSTIQDRGLYNATELEAAIANRDVRGRAILADAGENLINNSFVTVTYLLVYDNKPLADTWREIGTGLMNAATTNANATQTNNTSDQFANAISSLAVMSTASGFLIAAGSIKDGYTVVSTTFLFKLKWNGKIQEEFYKNWGNDVAFERMNFQLEFVGHQINETVINRGAFSKKANRKPELVIKQAVVKNIDEAYAELQKENDVFKPMMPVIETNPIIAQIGYKESITGKSKFEVLRKTENPQTRETKWEKVGEVKVDKIWDNRYYAGTKDDRFDDDGNSITVAEAKGTTFKGGREVQPGMMLKLIK